MTIDHQGCCLQNIASQVELRMKYSFLLKESYITFAHPIFIEIMFEFHKTVKNQNENVLIHAEGCMFCVEMIITHISYSHHFMTLIFFFYVMIALRICVTALLVSLSISQSKSLTKPTQLSQPIKIGASTCNPPTLDPRTTGLCGAGPEFFFIDFFWGQNATSLMIIISIPTSFRVRNSMVKLISPKQKCFNIFGTTPGFLNIKPFCLKLLKVWGKKLKLTKIHCFAIRIPHPRKSPICVLKIGSVTHLDQRRDFLWVTDPKSAAWLSNNLTVQFMILMQLEGQPNIICKPILSISSSEDESLLLPLSPKPVFKSTKATVSSFGLCVCLNDRDEAPLPAAGLFKAHSKKVSTESPHALHNQTYFSTWLFLKHCYCIIAKGFYYLDFLLTCRGFQLNLGPSSPKIRLNICTTYNQHITGISSVYNQIKRNHLHSSAMEIALKKNTFKKPDACIYRNDYHQICCNLTPKEINEKQFHILGIRPPKPICILKIGSANHLDQCCNFLWVADPKWVGSVSNPLLNNILNSFLFLGQGPLQSISGENLHHGTLLVDTYPVSNGLEMMDKMSIRTQKEGIKEKNQHPHWPPWNQIASWKPVRMTRLQSSQKNKPQKCQVIMIKYTLSMENISKKFYKVKKGAWRNNSQEMEVWLLDLHVGSCSCNSFSCPAPIWELDDVQKKNIKTYKRRRQNSYSDSITGVGRKCQTKTKSQDWFHAISNCVLTFFDYPAIYIYIYIYIYILQPLQLDHITTQSHQTKHVSLKDSFLSFQLFVVILVYSRLKIESFSSSNGNYHSPGQNHSDHPGHTDASLLGFISLLLFSSALLDWFSEPLTGFSLSLISLLFFSVIFLHQSNHIGFLLKIPVNLLPKKSGLGLQNTLKNSSKISKENQQINKIKTKKLILVSLRDTPEYPKACIIGKYKSPSILRNHVILLQKWISHVILHRVTHWAYPQIHTPYEQHEKVPHVQSVRTYSNSFYSNYTQMNCYEHKRCPSLALRWILSDLPHHTVVYQVNSPPTFRVVSLSSFLKVVATRQPHLTSSQLVQVLANYSYIIIHIRTAQLSLLIAIFLTCISSKSTLNKSYPTLSLLTVLVLGISIGSPKHQSIRKSTNSISPT
ncbi:hypothetical protein VP01_116g2 [Puccinia sorghi]|uniref:Uncharacterized protein n=1 Tax=Puccinia sorghi TaxID=27349 RepID=A0A0L6VRA8_9BASI|nr:hypothetical protein VP01_116g2 [Puccinia sorghi]